MVITDKILSDLFDKANNYTIKNNKLIYEEIFDFLFVLNKNKYFKKLVVLPNIPSSGAFGDFSVSEQAIYIYVEAISRKLENDLSNSHDRKFVISLIYNELLRCILHEIEHSKQYTLRDSLLKKSLEKNLMEYSLVNDNYEELAYILLKQEGRIPNITNMQEKIWLLSVLWKDFYINNYLVIPAERLAEIKTYSSLENMYKVNQKYDFLGKFANLCKIKSMIEGYKLEGNLVLAPTTIFIDKFDKTIFGGSIPFDWYSDNPVKCLDNVSKIYDFKKRLYFGLPVTLDEYKHAESVLQKKEDEFDSECSKRNIFVKKF